MLRIIFYLVKAVRQVKHLVTALNHIESAFPETKGIMDLAAQLTGACTDKNDSSNRDENKKGNEQPCNVAFRYSAVNIDFL